MVNIYVVFQICTIIEEIKMFEFFDKINLFFIKGIFMLYFNEQKTLQFISNLIFNSKIKYQFILIFK